MGAREQRIGRVNDGDRGSTRLGHARHQCIEPGFREHHADELALEQAVVARIGRVHGDTRARLHPFECVAYLGDHGLHVVPDVLPPPEGFAGRERFYGNRAGAAQPSRHVQDNDARGIARTSAPTGEAVRECGLCSRRGRVSKVGRAFAGDADGQGCPRVGQEAAEFRSQAFAHFARAMGGRDHALQAREQARAAQPDREVALEPELTEVAGDSVGHGDEFTDIALVIGAGVHRLDVERADDASIVDDGYREDGTIAALVEPRDDLEVRA